MQIVCGVICLLIVVGMAATIYLWRTACQLLKAMIRAALYIIRSGRYYGGSTITQQLVKNVYLTHERTIRRKALEVIIVLQHRSFSRKCVISAALFGGKGL